MLTKARHCPQRIWQYSHADFSRARQLISDFGTRSLFCQMISMNPGTNGNTTFWPRGVLPPRRRNLPWLNVQSMRMRNKKAKISSDSERKYRQARNKVVSLLRSAKKEFFRKLNPVSRNSSGSQSGVQLINPCSISVLHYYHHTKKRQMLLTPSSHSALITVLSHSYPWTTTM